MPKKRAHSQITENLWLPRGIHISIANPVLQSTFPLILKKTLSSKDHIIQNCDSQLSNFAVVSVSYPLSLIQVAEGRYIHVIRGKDDKAIEARWRTYCKKIEKISLKIQILNRVSTGSRVLLAT